MAGDASYASVVLLLHGDGSNGSTTFTDNSPTPKTPSGGVAGQAQISTAQKKYGTASMAFDGSGDYFLYPDNAAWAIGANDFTLEAWVYRSVSGVMHVIASQWSAGTATDNSFLFYIDASNKLTFSYGSGATNNGFSSATSVASGAWVHVAATRSGSTVRLFIGGVLDANTLTTVGALNNSTQSLAIGAWQSGGVGVYANSFNGYIDDFRFTNGAAAARYTATFSPPAAAFQDGIGQVSGTVKDAAGANAARTVRAYRRDTGAQVASVTSDGSTGAYSFYTPTLDELTVLALDSATSGTYYDDIVARVIPA